MKKQQHTKLALSRETLLLLTHTDMRDVAGGRIDLSKLEGCETSRCTTTIPITDRCFTITCANG